MSYRAPQNDGAVNFRLESKNLHREIFILAAAFSKLYERGPTYSRHLSAKVSGLRRRRLS